ncbi:MAG TPA: peptide ABC transporter substrate-binding protein [Phycisphaerae bacterium]|nr:peptide ABC transporter substrate-binding protein [Phycisphaerae bacterium]HNU45594.1 peptide ABC transporter substrate-binding protein [Phycisphaerae bacterium]
MIRVLLLGCLLLIGLAGAWYGSRASEPPADFRYVNPSDLHTLDPARMSWTPDLRVALNVWEGLTSYDPQTTAPVEGTALWPPTCSPDRRVYTFALRPDARWSNGDPVTAADFIRGWRRAVEPGTAADYAFLITDYVAGAKEYGRWRLEGVGVLTALSRLSDGWRITPEQAQALVRHPIWRDVQAAGGPASLPPPAADDKPAWDAFLDRLTRGAVDWRGFHDAAFEAHVAEMDERFASVGLRAVDERTLEVRLARPCPYFLDLTAFPTLMPIHASIELLRECYRGAPLTAEGLVAYDPQWTKPDYRRNGYGGLVSNGAYGVADWRFKRRLRLAANPYYHDRETVACQTVDMLVYPDVSTSLLAYETGEVDFLPAMEVPFDHEIARLAESGERPDFHLCVTLATYFFNFNCASEEVEGRPNPLRDARVRRALSLATDREALVKRVLQRGDRPAHSLVPPDAIPGYQPPAGLRPDPEAARRLLVEAGYAPGSEVPPLEILYTPSDERVCQALARMWEEELGIRVELRCKETKTFAEDRAAQRYLIARANWYADYNDPTTFLDCLLTGNGNNDSGYANPAYDALLAEAAEAADAAVRAELLQQAEALIVEQDCPILPILHYATPIAIKPNVHGLYPNARLVFPFRYVRVER